MFHYFSTILEFPLTFPCPAHLMLPRWPSALSRVSLDHPSRSWNMALPPLKKDIPPWEKENHLQMLFFDGICFFPEGYPPKKKSSASFGSSVFCLRGGKHPDPKRNILNPSKSWSFGRCIFLLQRWATIFFVEPCLFFWGLWTRFILPKFQGDTPLEDPATTFKQIGSLLGFFLSIQGFNQWWFNFRFMSFFLRKTDLSSSGFINEVVKTNCTLPKTEQQKFLRINVALEDEISKFWSQYRPIFRDSSCWEGILWLGSNPIYSISKWLPYSVVTLW